MEDGIQLSRAELNHLAHEIASTSPPPHLLFCMPEDILQPGIENFISLGK